MAADDECQSVISLDICALEAALQTGDADAWATCLQRAGWPDTELDVGDAPEAVRALQRANQPPDHLAAILPMSRSIMSALPVIVPLGFVGMQQIIEALSPSALPWPWVQPALIILWAAIIALVVGLNLLAHQYKPHTNSGRVGSAIQRQRRAALRAISEQAFVAVVGDHIIENHPGASRLRELARSIESQREAHDARITSLIDMMQRFQAAGLDPQDPQHRDVARALERQRDIENDQRALLHDIETRLTHAREAHQRLRTQARQLRLRRHAAELMQTTASHHDHAASVSADLEVDWLDLSSRHAQTQRRLAEMGTHLSTQSDMTQAGITQGS